jgi:hypothetical protein
LQVLVAVDHVHGTTGIRAERDWRLPHGGVCARQYSPRNRLAAAPHPAR